jgi:predicted RNA-binding protein YlqC (UPF0109 family)
MAEKLVDQDFLEYLVKSIVDHPEDVTVDRTIDDLGVLLRLKVHKDDMGQVVGRQGATAKAIRSLLRIVGIKHQARVNLKIEEPEGSTHVRPEVAPRPVAPRQTQTTSYSPAAAEAMAGKPGAAPSERPAMAAEASGPYVPSTPKFDGPVADELKF